MDLSNYSNLSITELKALIVEIETAEKAKREAAKAASLAAVSEAAQNVQKAREIVAKYEATYTAAQQAHFASFPEDRPAPVQVTRKYTPRQVGGNATPRQSRSPLVEECVKIMQANPVAHTAEMMLDALTSRGVKITSDNPRTTVYNAMYFGRDHFHPGQHRGTFELGGIVEKLSAVDEFEAEAAAILAAE